MRPLVTVLALNIGSTRYSFYGFRYLAKTERGLGARRVANHRHTATQQGWVLMMSFRVPALDSKSEMCSAWQRDCP